MQRRFGTFLAAGAALGVALVLAHDLAFLARYGSAYGEALAHAGHGPAWSWAVAGSAALGLGLLVAAAFGWYRLRAEARRLGARASGDEPGVRAFIRTWASAAARLAAGTAVLLTIQENVERVSSGIAVPNPALLLSAEYPFAPAIVVAVAAVVAFVFALVRWRRAILVERLRAARRPVIRIASAPRPVVALERRPEAFYGGRLAVRGPPRGVAIVPA